MKHILVCLFSFFFIANCFAFDAGSVVVQSGHIAPVTKLASTPDENVLVSISEDGTLRAWSRTSKKLIRRMQVGALPLVDLAVHPTEPRAAVIESDGISIYRLSVWDWEENRRVFSRNMEALPLYFSFSPGGSFLAYSVADWESMTILDSNTGSRPPYLKNGFGIVSAFRISSSESRILVYLSSGSIQYRDLRLGNLVQEYRTLADLEQISFVSNNRFMIGLTDDTLVAIDLLSGVDVDSVRVPGIESYTVDESSSVINCLVGPDADDESSTLQSFIFSRNSFRSRFSRYSLPDDYSSNFIEVERTMYTGTGSGEIMYQPYSSSNFRLFSRNRLLQIDDFDASNSLMIASPSTIMTLYADYLFRPGDQISESVITYTQNNPLNAPVSVHPLGDGAYVILDTSSPVGRYQVFSPVEGAVGLPISPYSAPILSLETRDNLMLTVDSAGRIQLFDHLSQSFVFETQVRGIKTAVFAGPDSIVAAGRRSQTLQTSKLLIDTVTGETVPFNDTSIQTFSLAYDPSSRTLYTLSLEGTTTSPRTVLSSFSGSIFERSETLYTIPERALYADMSVDSGTLFLTSAGTNKVLYARAGRLMHAEENDNIPVKVEVIDNWIIGLNRDYSLTAWDRLTGEVMVNFYLFENLSWAAVTKAGQVVTSTGSLSQYITR